MPTVDNKQFRYLNRDNHWADFQWQGLALRPDGALQLISLPSFEGELPQVDGDDGAAGLAIAADCHLYYSVPSEHVLGKRDICDDSNKTLPCLGGEGSLPGQLNTPRGLLFHPQRQVLMVADSGNHRIQLLDSVSLQVIDVWEQFDQPWSLAADVDGYIYVVDYGTKQLHKHDLWGRKIPEFWDTAQTQLTLEQPTQVAVNTVADGKMRVYLLDSSALMLFVLDGDGNLLESLDLDAVAQPLGLAVTDEAIYVGANGSGRVIKFNHQGVRIGEARGYEGPVAALAVDDKGNLWVHPGDGAVPAQLELHGAHVKGGLMWGGPFGELSSQPERWHRLRAEVEALAGDSHMQFFVTTTAEGTIPALDVSVDEPFETAAWTKQPMDAVEFIIPVPSEHLVWVGIQFHSEGQTTPALHQLRVDFDHTSYLDSLPAIYHEDPTSREFLLRFLSLFESSFNDIETQISDMAALFDPQATPTDLLSWLAGWLDLELNQAWDEDKKRELIEAAFQLYGKRGTAAGLRKALRLFLGIEARVEEPILNATWWCLPEANNPAMVENGVGSALGFTTMLVPAEAQGAVVGTSATLDHSHLISDAEFGAPLFEDVAYQFTVYVHRAQVPNQQRLDAVHRLIEREKPAHTAYQLCIIDPIMRVGFQARLGLDSVVSASTMPTRLGTESPQQSEIVLAGEAPGGMGVNSRIGMATRLGGGV